MKANQLATLVLRLMGIYILVEAIPVIATSYPGIYGSLYSGSLLFTLGLVLLLGSRIAIGILLIAFSGLWGQKIIPQNAGEEKISAISFEQIQFLAFAVIGILIFAGALPQLFNSIFYFLLAQSSHTAHGNSYEIGSVVGALLKAGLGLWLFFGAHGFANFWRSMRNFGAPRPPQT